MKSITKRIISTLVICGALVLEASATAIGSLGKALNNIAKVDAADTTKTLTFDLTSNPGDWPTANSTTLTNYTYTLGDIDYTFGLKNVKCNSGYLMLTSTAILGLPAIENYKLTKVVAKNSSGCSQSTKVGISSSSSSASYISGGAIQTWSTRSSSYTYDLSGTEDETVYYLYVTNKNAQITELTLTYKGGSDPTPTTGYTVSFAANGGGSSMNALTNQTSITSAPDCTFTAPSNKTFDYWSVGGTKVTYPYSVTADCTFTANWKDSPQKPTDYTEITSFTNPSEKMGSADFNYSGSSSAIKGYKGGTTSVFDNSIDVSVPAGANKLLLFCAGWKGKTVYVELDSNYTDDGKITINNDSGMTSNSPFTLSEASLFADKYRVEFNLKNITSQTTLTLSFSGERVGLWYAGYKLGNVKTLNSIAVTSNPSKTTYNIGETFDPTGMVVTATYDNTQTGQTTEPVTGYTYSPNGKLTSSDNKITISYTENNVAKTTTLNIDVLYLHSISVSADSAKKEYREGETLDLNNVSVTKTIAHSNGSTSETTAVTSGLTFTPASGATLTKENTSVSVSYTENGITKSDSYSITVGDPYVTSITHGDVPEELGAGGEYYPSASISPEKADQKYDVAVTSAKIKGTDDDFTEYTFGDDGTGKTVLKISQTNTSDAVITLTYTSNDIKSDGEKATTSVDINVVGKLIPILGGFKVTSEDSLVVSPQYRDSKDFELDLTGLTITGTYDINPDGFIPETFGYDDFDWDVETYDYPYGTLEENPNLHLALNGVNSDETTYKGIELENDALASIAFDSTTMNKKTYIIGQEWNFTGLSIKGKMKSNDDATIVQENVVYTADKSTSELGTGIEKSITVTAAYGSGVEPVSTTITGITIEEVAYTELEVKQHKEEYFIGDTIDKVGLNVLAHKNFGEPDDVTDDVTLSKVDNLTPGTKKVTVELNGLTTEYSVLVKAKSYDETVTWKKVTSELEDWSGEYLLVYESDSTAYVWTGLDQANCNVTATISSSTIASQPTGAASLIIEQMDGGYSVKVNGGTNNGKYISGTSGSNKTNFGTSESANTISYDATNECISIISNTSVMRFNNAATNGMWFRYYKSSSYTNQKAVQLYKKDVQKDDPVLKGITVELKDPTQQFNVGYKLKKSELVVTKRYDDGSNKVLEDTEFEIVDPVLSNEVNDIEVKFGNFSNTITINAVNYGDVTDVKVIAPDGYSKTYYKDGSEDLAWDLTNINVEVSWTGGQTTTIALQNLVDSGDLTLENKAPQVGDTSFTVSGSYQGVSVNQNYNKVTGIEVLVKQISDATWNQPGGKFSYKAFVGDKFDFENCGTVTGTFNDGSTFSAIKLLELIKKGYVKLGLWKDGTISGDKAPDCYIDEDFVWTADCNGGKIALVNDYIKKSRNATFEITEKLNPIYQPVVIEDLTLTTSSFTNLPEYNGDYSKKTDTVDGVEYEYENFYKFTSSGVDYLAFNKGSDAYIKNTTPLENNIKTIKLNYKDYYAGVVCAVSKDGKTWTTITSSASDNTLYEIPEGYRYFKLSQPKTQTSNYINLSNIVISYYDRSDIANTNFSVQNKVVEFANWVNSTYSDGISADDWATVKAKYEELITEVLIGDDLLLAQNMLKYATASDTEGSDCLQKCVNLYDTAAKKYNLVDSTNNFMGRTLEADTYAYSYDVGSGQATGGSDAGSYVYGSKITLPSVSYEGYKFDGWYTDSGFTTPLVNTDGKFNMPAGAVTAYAKWVELDTYNVELTEDSKFVKGLIDAEGNPVESIKEGQNLELIVDKLDSATTLPTEIIVEIDGVVLSSDNYSYGDVLGVTMIKIGAQYITGDVSITIVATHGDIEVGADLDGLTVDTTFPQTVAYGTTISGTLTPEDNRKLPASITVDGVDSSLVTYNPETGKFSFPANAVSEITISAYADYITVNVDHSSIETSKINYSDSGQPVYLGSNFVATILPQKGYENVELTITMNNVTLVEGEDYTYNSTNGELVIKNITGNIVINATASLIPEEYDVKTYGDDHVTVSADSETVTAGGSVTITVTPDTYNHYHVDVVTYTMSGGKPIKATLDENNEFTITNVSGDIVVKATSAIDTYSVTYKPDSQGSGDERTDTKTYGVDLTLADALFTREGYTQVGWATSDGGEKVYDLKGTYSADAGVTLYPVWEANTYKVTFDGNEADGWNNPEISQTYDATYVLPESDPIKTGYTFLGWFTAKDGGEQVTTSTVVKLTDATTLYAHWQVVTYTVTPKPDTNSYINVDTSVAHGDDLVVEVGASEHYHLVTITYTVEGEAESHSVNPTDLVEGKFTIEGVTGKVTISVTSAKDTVSVTTTLKDSTAQSEITSVEYDGTYTNTFTGKEGYSVVNITYQIGDADPVTVTGNTVTINNVTAALTIIVNTEAAEAVVTGITVQPTEITVAFGEDVNLNSLVVTATYSDGTSKTVTGFTVTDYNKDVAGEYEATVEYTEGDVTVTCPLKVTVNAEVVLESISVDPTSVTIAYGGSIDVNSLTVTAHYSDGGEVPVTDFVLGNYNAKQVGEQDVTITYQGETCTLKLVVEDKVIDHIEVVEGSYTTSVYQGDEYTFDGKVNVYYVNDEEPVEISEGFTVSEIDTSTLGEKTLTVSYGGKSVEVKVNVVAKPVQPTVTELVVTDYTNKIEVGGTYTFDGIVVAKYSDGTEETLKASDYTVSALDTSTEGEKTVTITFGDKTKDITVTVYKPDQPTPAPQDPPMSTGAKVGIGVGAACGSLGLAVGLFFLIKLFKLKK